MAKGVLGVVESVRVIGLRGEEGVMAIVDTGAKVSSLDSQLAKKVGVGRPVRTMKVKNASLRGHVMRPVVRVRIKLRGRIFDTEANIQDRRHMRFPVIIGRNILTGNFRVDPEINKGAVEGDD